jgi:RNA polymerase sigma-70 factor (ECF subfamily)
LEETLLVSNLVSKNEDAFKELVEEFQDRVYNTVLGFLKNSEDAEDISQEVFIEVFNSIDNFQGKSGLSTWIYRIAVNKSLELIRKRKRKKRFAFLKSLFLTDENYVEIPDWVHPGVQLERKEQASVLFKQLDKLPENQKVAFTLHKIEGLSYREIEEVMSLSRPAVESLMFRARKNLTKLLHDYYKNEVGPNE